FTNQTEVIAYARPYLPWIIAVPFVSLAAFIWDGIYIGLTLTSRMFFSMLVSAIVFFALWSLLGPSNHALWFSFVAYLATRSLMQTVLISRYSVPSV
ncbi:MAG: MATE family efflux transporter, partial [Bacteroidaceae bacterium]|nr:MATE family efflux transporter [Bacteroidaceae bacterium]